MEHFYSQEGRDDIKSGSERWLPLLLLCAENSVVNKVGSAQKLREAQLMGPYSGLWSMNSNNDATVQSVHFESL